MGVPACKVEPLYKPRDPQASPLWQLLSRWFDEFERVYDDRFADKYGWWRPEIRKSVDAYLKCGDLNEGFARVRCPDCGHTKVRTFTLPCPHFSGIKEIPDKRG